MRQMKYEKLEIEEREFLYLIPSIPAATIHFSLCKERNFFSEIISKLN
jgi:hypothetical protein